MKTIGILAVLFGFIIIAVFISIVGRGCNVASGVANKVVNPDAIVNNYEWYHMQFEAIEAQAKNIKVIQERCDKKDTERCEIELSGLMMGVNSMIAEYNAKSKMITRNMWKPRKSDLPQTINFGDFGL
jgi:hypothetical protein